MANAPPEPPSPVMVTTMGTGSRAISRRFRAMASACPRSSASIPGYAPGVSTKVRLGLPEILRHALFGVPSLLLPHKDDRAPTIAGKACHHRGVIAVRAVAVQFLEILKQDAHVVHHVGTLRVAR